MASTKTSRRYSSPVKQGTFPEYSTGREHHADVLYSGDLTRAAREHDSRYGKDGVIDDKAVRARERVLGRRAQRGDQSAIEELVSANLRFAKSRARKYQTGGLEFDDLVAEANMGLFHAATKFNPDCKKGKGIKFISYAVAWIDNYCLRALNKHGRPVKLPDKAATDIRAVSQLLADRLAAGEDEMTALYNASKEHLKKKKKKHKRPQPVTEEEIHEMMRLQQMQRISFDAPIESDKPNAPSLGERMVGESDDTLALFATRYVRQAVDSGVLTERERMVLIRRSGMYDPRINEHAKEHTLQEIGDMIGRTRERIRQIEKKALRKLREELPEAEEMIDWFHEEGLGEGFVFR